MNMAVIQRKWLLRQVVIKRKLDIIKMRSWIYAIFAWYISWIFGRQCGFIYGWYVHWERYFINSKTVSSVDDNAIEHLRCGTVQGVYATVDFGTDADITQSFDCQRQYAPHGPLVNTEFYVGWLDLYGHEHSTVSTEAIVKTLDDMLAMGVNVNFYMFRGGTNFGFTSG